MTLLALEVGGAPYYMVLGFFVALFFWNKYRRKR
jgi:hypothetical protein